jgi:ribonuclease Z
LICNDQLNEIIKKKEITAIIHTCGEGVAEDHRYIEWIRSCHKSVEVIFSNIQHIILSQSHGERPIIFETSNAFINQMNAVDDAIFPKLQRENILPSLPEIVGHKCRLGTPLLDMQIEPKFRFDYPTQKEVSLAIDFSVSDVLLNIKEEERSVSHAAGSNRNVVVTPLGTGSAIPSKHRNVSSTLLSIEDTVVMLDAGEGTFGQLCRRFGAETSQVLLNMKTLFVSHLHADHHLGIFTVICEWMSVHSGTEKRLQIIGPSTLKVWMEEYDSIQELGISRIDFYDCDLFLQGGQLENKLVQTIAVDHCDKAYAVVMTIKDYKVSFSGDCRPSSDFEVAGLDSDLLIHEATFDDVASALQKKHSTIQEAIHVGKKYF